MRLQPKTSPIPILLSCGDSAITYFTRRDLLGENAGSPSIINRHPEVQRLLRSQQPDGSWHHSGKHPVRYPKNHYSLVETWRNLWVLVERYQCTRQTPQVEDAAEYLLSFQTRQGDIRGMLGNQYATYYTGAMLSVLLKAGYLGDSRVEKGMDWLLTMRQNDGGWTIPLLTRNLKQAQINILTSTDAPAVEADPKKPYSHNWTDMALRAFAVHPTRRHSREVHTAAEMLKKSFFQPDNYTSYQDPAYWVRFMHWWPNLLTALEVLQLLGYRASDPDVERGMQWFVDNQLPDGLWLLDNKRTAGAKQKESAEQYWLALRVAKMFRGFSS